MEEDVYKCLCGSRGFEIYSNRLKCIECGKEYNYYHGFLHEPKVFNGRKEAFLRKK